MSVVVRQGQRWRRLHSTRRGEAADDWASGQEGRGDFFSGWWRATDSRLRGGNGVQFVQVVQFVLPNPALVSARTCVCVCALCVLRLSVLQVKERVSRAREHYWTKENERWKLRIAMALQVCRVLFRGGSRGSGHSYGWINGRAF